MLLKACSNPIIGGQSSRRSTDVLNEARGNFIEQIADKVEGHLFTKESGYGPTYQEFGMLLQKS